MPEPRKLTPKQELFIIEYSKDFNATQAAIRAGYKGKYIDRTAHQLLEKTRGLIEERKQQRLKEAANVPSISSALRKIDPIATLEQSLRMVTALAFYDPRRLYEGDSLKPQSKLTRREALMVTGFEVDENFVGVGEKAVHVGYTKKVKLVDRAPYLNMLMKWHRAFAEKEPPKAPASEMDLSNWTAEDFEAYQKLKAKLHPNVIDADSTTA